MSGSPTPIYSSSNTTNNTLTNIIGDTETGNMNIGQAVSIDSAAMGGIGAGVALAAIIAAGVVYSIFSKKAPPKKGKKKGGAFSEMDKIGQLKLLIQHTKRNVMKVIHHKLIS
jgi:hypothetical protein